MTRHALAQDLNPASNRNCFVVPAAVRGEETGLTVATAGIGTPGLALPKYPPLGIVMAPEPETGGDSP